MTKWYKTLFKSKSHFTLTKFRCREMEEVKDKKTNDITDGKTSPTQEGQRTRSDSSKGIV